MKDKPGSYVLEESDGDLYAYVHLPASSSSVIDIVQGSVSAETLTVAVFMSAAAGIFLVATATIYLFRK